MMEQTRCPLCGRELEAGGLAAGGQPIKWTTKRRSLTGAALGPGEVGLQEGIEPLSRNTVPALMCRGCRLVIADTLEG